MPDAVLVASKNSAQEIKKIVPTLKANNIMQAELFPKEHRPWGWYETLMITKQYHVKCIMIKPGGILSLQSHKYRSEHWIIVEGKAKVTIGNSIKYFSKGESVFIPVSIKHRLENDQVIPIFLIEIQTGTYFGEDDIVRYEDVYSRL